MVKIRMSPVSEQIYKLKRNLISFDKFIKIYPLFFVDVSATTAAFVRTTVHQVSLWQTVSSHRCVEVGRTPRFGSSTCLVLF